MLSTDDFLDSTLGATQAALTTKGNYRYAYRYINITSYSQRELLHECPRKFQQIKIVRAAADSFELPNLDFIFGHAVGAGVQAFIVTGSRNAAFFACFLAWNTDLNAEFLKKGKSFYFALLAVWKFADLWSQTADEWEIATFNNRAASELLFWIDCENGYYHVGHIDVILRHKVTGKYKIVEVKTTSMKNPDEAQYGNSDQALGYSVVLDSIARSIEEVSVFDVLYPVYSSTNREWTFLPFPKSRNQRAEWLQDLLLDHTTIQTYLKLGFFPKRGNACWSFSKRCPHYGICDLKDATQLGRFEKWTSGVTAYPETPDFTFTLSQLVKGIRDGTT